MPHFFVSPGAVANGHFFLEQDEARHLCLVLRKKPGDKIRLFDGKGHNYHARIDHISSARVQGIVLSEESVTPWPWSLRLFQGMPKGDKFDWILEKMTELGASEVVPVYTERSMAKIPSDKLGARVKRWEKILLSAAKQSGQSRVPKVMAPVLFSEAVKMCARDSLSLFPWEGEEKMTLKQVLRSSGCLSVINVFIGPEGGFTPQEVSLAQNNDMHLVSLGPLIFRTETAGLFVASALLYELGLSS